MLNNYFSKVYGCEWKELFLFILANNRHCEE